MPNFTPTTNAAAIPTVIAQGVIAKLPGYMNLAKTVAKDSDFSENFNVGDTLSIDKTGLLTARQKLPGTPIVTQAPTASKVDVKLDQHWYVSFLQEDITKMLQKPNLQESYANDAAIALAEKIETVILALHPSITNTITFDATSSTTIETSFLRMRSFFSRAKVPQLTDKYAYLDTSVIDKLLTIEKYTNANYMGDAKTIAEGALRKIYNINIFESQLVPATGSPVAYHNLAYTRDGIVLVHRPMVLDGNGRGVRQSLFNDQNTGLSLRLTEGYDQDEMGVKITMDVLFGAGVANSEHLLEVESF